MIAEHRLEALQRRLDDLRIRLFRQLRGRWAASPRVEKGRARRHGCPECREGCPDGIEERCVVVPPPIELLPEYSSKAQHDFQHGSREDACDSVALRFERRTEVDRSRSAGWKLQHPDGYCD